MPPDNPRRTIRAVAQGAVQGVGFRWFVRESAREHDLAGWVRNQPDGSVEVIASGPAADIEKFLDATRVGPRRSRVDTLQVEEFDGRHLNKPFDIRR